MILLFFLKRDFDGNDGKFLFLEFFVFFLNYWSIIEFVVNFFEFMSDNGYFCSSLFWNFLLKMIVVKDLKFG